MNPLYMYPLLGALAPRRRCASTHVGHLQVATLITAFVFVILMKLLGTPVTTATAIAVVLVGATVGYAPAKAAALTASMSARLGRLHVPSARPDTYN